MPGEESEGKIFIALLHYCLQRYANKNAEHNSLWTVPKTTKNKLKSKIWKSEGKAALLKPLTNEPAGIKQILPLIYCLHEKKKKKKEREVKTPTIFII